MSNHRSLKVRAVAAGAACLFVLAACGSENVVEDAALGKDPGIPTIPIPTTTEPLESAKGKDCKQATDVPEFEGKPAVLMPTGAPPAELETADIKVGEGEAVTEGDPLTVNYVGIACSTGKEFDSSWAEGREPLSFTLQEPQAENGGQGVIVGWVKGLTGMKPGGIRQLVIPPDMAYGEDGRPGIAPDETLVFVVELLQTESEETATTVAGATETTAVEGTETTVAETEATTTTEG